MTRAAFGLALLLVTSGCEAERVKTAERGKALAHAAEIASGVASSLRCVDDAWPVYAHDEQRSGASSGCCKGPLSPLWRFEPPPKPPRNARTFHAVVTRDAVYVSGVIGESPSVFALDLEGKPLWTFDSHVDITRHEWPSFVLDRVVLNDDGLYILDSRSGEQEVNRGLDSWGQVITNGRNLLAVNTWYIAGPKTFVGALEVGGAPLWKKHEYGLVREDVLDRLGGIALAGERVLFAPNYAPSPGAGVYACAAGDGAELWRAETIPKSHLSVAGESAYLFERPDGEPMPTLVARDVEHGKRRWTFQAESSEATAPLAAGSRILFRERGGGVVAVRRGEGTLAWRAQLSLPEASDVAWATSQAAALGSGTLVAVDGTELVVLSLADGSVEWRGRPSSLSGAVHSPVVAGGRVYVVDRAGVAALGCAP
ncbi:MAG: PQQ-binding-like beta-propeller repeat protein [Polyangiaceae bacterium]|nr:PQQ-binding-like beta-propeller repeat protein [Polyangiaceae bacterium]MCL4751783.1 PQQ-binding-like beta-propeller repeat protein [Myxococcales bacterium]